MGMDEFERAKFTPPRTSELTKREYFAAMAMQSILTKFCSLADIEQSKNWITTTAISSADALIAELEKTK